ncbi:hypothetical protein [Gordonia terrae]|uniref:hypothetical protein n=1 Tax=Gordonia terrae TaxID=2055 RepID=UPI003F6D61CF
MAAGAHIILTLDESRVESGLWCPHCNLPSGWSAPVLGLSENGVGEFATVARCFDCDHPL